MANAPAHKTSARKPARTGGRPRRAPATSKRRPVTPEDLRSLSLVSGARVSPDGQSVVFSVKRAGDKNDSLTNLWIARRAGPPSRSGGSPWKWSVSQFTSGGKDASPEWTPGGEHIVFVSERQKGKPQLWSIPASGGEATPLTAFPEGSIGGFRISPDGTKVAVTFRATDADRTAAAAKQREAKGLSDPPWVLDDLFYREDGQGYFGAARYRLFLVELTAPPGASPAVPRLLYDKDNLGMMTFDWAPDSRRLVVASDRRKDALWGVSADELLILDTRTARFRAIPGLPGGCKNSPRWSPDGTAIAYAGHTGADGLYATDNVGVWTCSPAGGPARCLTKATDYCAVGIAITDTAESVFQPIMEWAPDSRSILLQLAWHGCGHVARIPRRGVRPGEEIRLTTDQSLDSFGNTSADASVVAFSRSTFDSPGEVCVGLLGRGGRVRVEQITDLNAEFRKSVLIARPRSRWVRAQDGHRTQAWVIEPPAAGRKRPAVLLIHGGPHAQYGVGYFHEMQVLASAGYVVVFSNPRGSKGYGREHTAAIRGDWGNKDWEDLRGVIAMMQEHPRIDPKRMGVAGGSYGGYMTNWIVGRSRAFRAAITDRCVSSIVSLGGNSDYPDPEDRYWPGNFWDRTDARRAQSPVKDFGKVRTPLLIIHAEGDLRCNIEQSETIFAILKMRGVPCRFIRYPRSCSHGMTRSGPMDMRLHRLHQTLEWWGRWLG